MEKKKSLGQCFLENRAILEKEALLAEIEGKRVLEIGAGDGRLSRALLARKPEKLVIVEKDQRFEKILKKLDAELIIGDFLEIDLPDVDVIVGNIPYYISSDIIFRLKSLPIERAILMVQKEFARKMVAKPGDSNYGRLSVTSQIFFNVDYLMTVGAGHFNPKPKVDSAIICLVPTGRKLSAGDEHIIRCLFSHKNKTVRNALRDSKIEDFEVGTFYSRRVCTLTIEEVLEISRMINKD